MRREKPNTVEMVPAEMHRERPTAGRTAVACRRCHTRKAKCTVSATVSPSSSAPSATAPCAGCVAAGVDCVLIESRRGKYPRRRRAGARHRPVERPADKSAETGAAPFLSAVDPLTRITTAATAIDQPPSPPASPDAFYAEIAHQGLNNATNDGSDDETNDDNNIDPTVVALSASSTTSVANSRPPPPASETVFLGEAFSLAYVLHDVLAPFLAADARHFRRRLHLPMLTNRPPCARTDVVARQAHHLRARGLPGDGDADSACAPDDDALIRCYLDHFHPAFPVVHGAQLRAAAADGTASLLVLSAVRMVAATICDDAMLADRHGCPQNRHALRRRYYQQAKALYDADLEPDKYDTIAGAFLMSFWWDGPDDQKDSWHWLGVATSLAQSLGMHRSMRYSGASTHKVQAWKRLWWSIRIRDTLVSGSIGRPQHASDVSCDVELPTADDVREAIGVTAGEEAVLYPVAMAQLAMIFSEILTSRYAAPGKTSASGPTRASIEAALDSFRAGLSPALHYTGITPRHGLWSATLLTAFNYASILLCRPSRNMDGREQTACWGNTARAQAAANEVTRLVEDILSASAARACQIHTIPALFNALAMHIWELGTSPSAVGRQLAEARCRTCMLGLDVLQVSWPVGGWVHRFFASTMDRLQGRLGGRRETTAVGSGQSRGSAHGTAMPRVAGTTTMSTTTTTTTNSRSVQHADPLQDPLINTPVEAWPPPNPSMMVPSAQAMGAGYPAYSLVYMRDEPLGGESNSGSSSNPRPSWPVVPPGSGGAVLASDFITDLFLFEDTGVSYPPIQQADFLDLLQNFS